jgi:hypothetical protein
MITLAPKHFVTKSINEKEKEISGPLVELTTAINKKKRVRHFPEKSFELVALADFITKTRRKRTIEEKVKLIKAMQSTTTTLFAH